MGYNDVADNTIYFIRLAVIAYKICEIPQNFPENSNL